MSDAFLILAMQSANHTGLVPYVIPNGRGNTWLEVSTDAASVTQCFTLLQYMKRISTYRDSKLRGHSGLCLVLS